MPAALRGGRRDRERHRAATCEPDSVDEQLSAVAAGSVEEDGRRPALPAWRDSEEALDAPTAARVRDIPHRDRVVAVDAPGVANR